MSDIAPGQADSVGPTIDLPAGERPGMTIGRYRLLEELGQGGFGVVYLAEQQEPVKRRVALKIIKLGMDTKQVIARFEAERQALALMNHPHIARVFDAGATESGRPFFVMELVRGLPITQFCDERNMTTAQRIGLFIQVCHAVQHAHQKGIIHRDLKPTNVLVTEVDDKPVPKVIDFGIAKATNRELTDKTIFTEYRQFVGTPEYMSPEQAAMTGVDIDTRSDIYSLGVLLYELLAGVTPFDPKRLRSAAFQELQRIIREVEPERPSTRISALKTSGAAVGDAAPDEDEDQAADDERSSVDDIARHRRTDASHLSRMLRGDLDWIVMKTLEKERSRRYESAGALAEDLRRFLDHEPVTAGPPSVGYRLTKFIRRNRALVGTAAIVTIAVLTGLAAAVTGFVQASHERDRAQQAEVDALREKAAADVARDEAEAARDEAEAVTEFLTDMFAAADPAQMGRHVTVAEVLDRASFDLDMSFEDHPVIGARLRDTIGRSYAALGLFDEAAGHLARAIETLSTELGEGLRTNVVRATLSGVYKRQGRLDEAEALLTRAMGYANANLDANDRRAIEISSAFGALRRVQTRFEEAEAFYLDVLDRARASLGLDHDETLTYQNNLAYLYLEMGRYDDAEALLLDAVERRENAMGPDHPGTLLAQHNLAHCYSVQDRYSEAEATYRVVLERRREVLGPDHPDTVLTLSNLASNLLDQRRRDEAEPIMREVIEIDTRTFGPEHSSTLVARMNLGSLLMQAGRHAEAEEIFRVVLEIQRRRLGEDHPHTLMTLNNLAGSLFYQQRIDDAIEILKSLVDIYTRKLGEKHPDTTRVQRNLMGLMHQEGQYVELVPYAQRVLPRERETYGLEHRRTLNAMYILANGLMAREEFDRAEPLALECHAGHVTFYGESHDETRKAVHLLIRLYEAVDRAEDAAAWRERLGDED